MERERVCFDDLVWYVRPILLEMGTELTNFESGMEARVWRAGKNFFGALVTKLYIMLLLYELDRVLAIAKHWWNYNLNLVPQGLQQIPYNQAEIDGWMSSSESHIYTSI